MTQAKRVARCFIGDPEFLVERRLSEFVDSLDATPDPGSELDPSDGELRRS